MAFAGVRSATSASSGRSAAAAWASSTRRSRLSLRRRVALKVLPFAATMDPKQLQRFQQRGASGGEPAPRAHRAGARRRLRTRRALLRDAVHRRADAGGGDRGDERAGSVSRPEARRTIATIRRSLRPGSPANTAPVAALSTPLIGPTRPRFFRRIADPDRRGRRRPGIRPLDRHRPPRREARQPDAGRRRQALGEPTSAWPASAPTPA